MGHLAGKVFVDDGAGALKLLGWFEYCTVSDVPWPLIRATREELESKWREQNWPAGCADDAECQAHHVGAWLVHDDPEPLFRLQAVVCIDRMFIVESPPVYEDDENWKPSKDPPPWPS